MERLYSSHVVQSSILQVYAAKSETYWSRGANAYILMHAKDFGLGRLTVINILCSEAVVLLIFTSLIYLILYQGMVHACIYIFWKGFSVFRPYIFFKLSTVASTLLLYFFC